MRGRQFGGLHGWPSCPITDRKACWNRTTDKSTPFRWGGKLANLVRNQFRWSRFFIEFPDNPPRTVVFLGGRWINR